MLFAAGAAGSIYALNADLVSGDSGSLLVGLALAISLMGLLFYSPASGSWRTWAGPDQGQYCCAGAVRIGMNWSSSLRHCRPTLIRVGLDWPGNWKWK